jgi:cobalamin-dependent methionine synthase I
LLIGGATTSRAHTAVKIDPQYSGPVVHVHDASRAVGVAGALLNPQQHDEFVERTRAEYAEVRRAHEGRTATEQRLTLEQARANRVPIDWHGVTPPRPTFLGARAFNNFPLEELVERIDWTPFFSTWELSGRYPGILTDPVVGEAASSLFRDAQKLAPDDVSVKTGLGISLVMSDASFKEAIGYLKDGVQADPKNSQAWLALGIAYQNLGRDAEAKQPYKEFLKLRPSGSQADEVRAALKAIP